MSASHNSRLSTETLKVLREITFPIVDSHHHLWHDRESSQRFPGLPTSYTWRDIVRDYDQAGLKLGGSIFIEASMRSSDGSSMDESAWAQSIANESKNQVCTGIQSAIDMVQSPQNFESALLSALKHPNFRGLRRIATKRDPVTGGYSGIEENPTVLELPNVRQNFATLNKHKMSYEVWYRLKPESSRATTAGFLSVVKNNPDVTFIVDHFLEPQGAYRDDAGMWNDCKHVMAEYSKFPNVYAKLSGLMPGLGGGFHLRQDHQKPSAVELAEGRFGEMVGYALDVFGPNKCMFGSNFPVDRISASLGDLVACYWLVGKSKGLSESGLREVFSGSCRRAYKLDGK